MSVTAETTTASNQYRLLGLLAVAGGLAYVIAGIVMAATGNEEHIAVSILGVGWALGAVCGLVGIGLLGAAGRGLFGRVSLAVAVLAYALAALDGLFILAGTYHLDDSPLFAVSRLGTLVGMLLVGITTVAVRRWAGWRRFAPFALLLVLPLGVLLSLVQDRLGALPPVGLAWMLIGYAVWSTPAGE